MLKHHHLSAFPITCALLAVPHQARAVDTLETFDPGAFDLEFYAGHDSLGLSTAERTGFADTFAGYGLAEGLSLYVGASGSADGRGNRFVLCPYAGGFGTPIESDHFDIDLALDLGINEDNHFVAAPAFEINFDHDPDMQTWGLYFHGSITLCRKARTLQKSLAIASSEATWAVGLGAGGYAAIAPGHQILVESDVSLRPTPDEGERKIELGGVALGYNAQLSDTVEWIGQGFFDIPQDDEPRAYGLLTGVILTLGI